MPFKRISRNRKKKHLTVIENRSTVRDMKGIRVNHAKFKVAQQEMGNLREVASVLGISRRTLLNIVNGHQQPSIALFRKMCKLFRLNENDLVLATLAWVPNNGRENHAETLFSNPGDASSLQVGNQPDRC